MSEPSPKRQKADEGDVAGIKGLAGEAAPADAPNDNGGLGLNPEEEHLANELDDCQKALDKVNDEASDRVLAVEREYNKKRRPIYAQRAEIIRKVPQFWQRALSSHPALADQLTDDDTAALEHLIELDVIDFDDIKSGFQIVLTFSPENPFFSDTKLTKTYNYGDDGRPTVQPAAIHWQQDFAPAPGLVGEIGPSYVFFTWLATDQSWADGGPDEIADIIKDEIWPNPVKYYYNELPQLDAEFEEMENEGAAVEGEGEGFEEALVVEGEELAYEEGEEEVLAAEGDGEGELGEGEGLDDGEEGGAAGDA